MVRVPRTRPPYPGEFRREAIRLAQMGDKRQRKLARDLGISDVTLRNWLKEEKAAKGERPGGLSVDERDELRRLRDENAKLEMEREILRKAAVFFAREETGGRLAFTTGSVARRPIGRSPTLGSTRSCGSSAGPVLRKRVARLCPGPGQRIGEIGAVRRRQPDDRNGSSRGGCHLGQGKALDGDCRGPADGTCETTNGDDGLARTRLT